MGPILSQARSDVFCDNENGANFLFQNNDVGTFVDRASQAGEYETGSGGTLRCLKLFANISPETSNRIIFGLIAPGLLISASIFFMKESSANSVTLSQNTLVAKN